MPAVDLVHLGSTVLVEQLRARCARPLAVGAMPALLTRACAVDVWRGTAFWLVCAGREVWVRSAWAVRQPASPVALAAPPVYRKLECVPTASLAMAL